MKDNLLTAIFLLATAMLIYAAASWFTTWSNQPITPTCEETAYSYQINQEHCR